MPEPFIVTQTDILAAAPRSPVSSGEDEEAQEAQPDLMTLRMEYTTLSHQLAQLDINKQAGQWARLYRQVQAAEARLRQAERESSPSQTSPPETANSAECAKNPETAKQHEVPSSHEGTRPPATEHHEAGDRQEHLCAIASDLLYWKGGLKVLRQAQLPKWRGCFPWQIEAKIEALQAAYAWLRTEGAEGGG